MKQIRILLKKIRKFSRFQKLILLAFLVALSFTAVRVVRTVSDMAYWHYHQDEHCNPLIVVNKIWTNSNLRYFGS